MPEMIAMAAAAAPPKLMTTEELLAMPDDGVRRWLIRGELREDREFAMTMRNRFHSEVEAKVVYILMDWLFRQPKPRGRVYCGEVGCRLRDDPESTVGIDVAYVSHQTLTEQRGKSTLIVGSPILVVEVVSPSTKFDDIVEKIGE